MSRFMCLMFLISLQYFFIRVEWVVMYSLGLMLFIVAELKTELVKRWLNDFGCK